MNADERQERLDRAHACFSLSVYWRSRGNEVLRSVREQPFKLAVDADDIMEGPDNGLEKCEMCGELVEELTLGDICHDCRFDAGHYAAYGPMD